MYNIGKTYFVTCLALVTVSYARGDNSVAQIFGQVSDEQETLAEFIYLGQFGNKEYYYENETGTSATGARLLCNIKGMRLAQIDTPDEVDWLRTRLNSSSPQMIDHPWTDAELFIHEVSFIWHTGGSDVNRGLGVYVYQTSALWFNSREGTFYGYPSSLRAKTLCFREVAASTPSGVVDVKGPREELTPVSLAAIESDPSKPLQSHLKDLEKVEIVPKGQFPIIPASFQYLGTWNDSKDYYLDAQPVNQADARHNCNIVGMDLARFHTSEEILWLEEVTNIAKDCFFWTDGVTRNESSVYRWVTRGSPVSNDLVVPYKNLGLAFQRHGLQCTMSHGHIVTYDKREMLPYLCHM